MNATLQWPNVRRIGRCGFPSTTHSIAPYVTTIGVERANDDVGSLFPAVAYARGAARQYHIDWGIDLSLWWGVKNGCVSKMPAEMHRRMLFLSYAAGASLVQLEGCEWVDENGTPLPIANEADIFGSFILTHLTPERRGKPDTIIAVVIPLDLGWSERTTWNYPDASITWNYANIPANATVRCLNAVIEQFYPGVGSFSGYHAFPYGRFENNVDPPPSPFARSSITASYAPTLEDVWVASSPITMGKFHDRNEVEAWFETTNANPSDARPLESTKWGDILDVIVNEESTIHQVIDSYPMILYLSPINSETSKMLTSYVDNGGVLILPVGGLLPSSDVNSLTGISFTGALRAVWAYSHLGSQTKLHSEPLLVAEVDSLGDEVIVLVRSVPEGFPIVVRNRNNIYTVLIPWLLGTYGLSSVTVDLLSELISSVAPVRVISGPEVVAYTSSTNNSSRVVTVSNNAAAMWQGEVEISVLDILQEATNTDYADFNCKCIWLRGKEGHCLLSDHLNYKMIATFAIEKYDVSTVEVECNA